MADLTKSTAVRDSSADYTETDAAASQTIVMDHHDEKVALVVRNTDATHDVTITVKKGTGLRADIGDLAVIVPGGGSKVIGPLDSMRFKSLVTGKITVTAAIASGGTLNLAKLAVVELP